MQKLLHLFLFTALTFSAAGQKLWQKQGYELIYPVCYASDKTEKSFIPPPVGFNRSLKSAEKRSEIIVSYSDFPENAIEAFEYAVSIWEQLIESPVPIYIQASWRELDRNVLGSCGPGNFEKNFPGAPQPDVYYPIALAEKLRGFELTGADRPDIIAEFNKNINWYFGTDGDTQFLAYDFVSVVLHEIGHGLGFTGFFVTLRLSGGYNMWDWGDATSFDRLVENEDGERLTDTTIFSNPSAALRDELVSDSLFADSPVAIAFGDSSKPRLYAPLVWENGSSIYHLNDDTYPSDDINSLMTHSMGRSQAIHHPGPVTLGILADLGWKTISFDHTPHQDMEEIQNLKFEVIITGDYSLDTNSPYLVYFTDSLLANSDSIPLQHVDNNLFTATLSIEPGTQMLSYYYSAADTINRVFTNPAGAPLNTYKVSFGPDINSPTISHEQIPFFLDTGEEIEITAEVEDNLAIDTVIVVYYINGEDQQPFGLNHISGSTYSGVFPVDNDVLLDGDQISYHIIATDASANQNTERFPQYGNFSFQVEKVFEPVRTYSNSFENGSNQFTLREFNIYTEEGFENGALHSPHPYPSPDEDNMEFNFTTILKHPVILNETAVMTFDEVVLVEPGNDETVYGDFEFWDYVIVEGSKDKGHSWLPLHDGYDSRADSLWEVKYYESIPVMNSTSVGSSDLFKNRQIDMLENGNFSAGDTILIRFRLFSDPFAHGWGWAIDNLTIQDPATASHLNLSPGNIRVYPNPFQGSFKVITEPKMHIDVLQYDLYNMHGQKINTLQLKNISAPVTSEILVEKGIPGMYLLVVTENGKQVLSKKIIHN